ncbi:hypothetical protein FHN55_19605 [Streptomyces sp. NP160]|uniref:M15 family metallopeptidase n=1 Tax=Streptomyces sp. NP160 TaxID=2586637 RepID=UPI0011190E06|nr:M15 family metallopeptidase [Streptomyces sp. NP160]TNM60003.1 hypothetical protein FHN55_19605 [Streptomyces sp. NP160]
MDVRERPSAARTRGSWPNSRASREELAARSGRRSALTDPGAAGEPSSAGRPAASVPSQRSTTALATPPDGFAELAALLGLPGQRTAPPSWARDWSEGMPPAHPSAPVPAPVPAPTAPAGRSGGAVPAAFAGGWPSTDEIAALEAPLRRRRRASSLPADGLVESPSAPVAPVGPAPVEARAGAPVAPAAQPAVAPAVPAPAPWSVPAPADSPAPVVRRPAAEPAAPVEPLTRRARRAAQGPVDLQPRSAEPARPGSRRALRQQAALSSGAAAPSTAPDDLPALRTPAGDEPAWSRTEREQPTSSDTDVLARLEALLAEPAAAPAWEPLAPSELDLRTDPLLVGPGWTRLGSEPVVPAAPVAPPVAPAEVLSAPSAPSAEAAPAPWTQPVEITPVVLAPVPAAAAVAEALLAEPGTPATTAFTPRRGRGAHRLPRRVRVALPHVAVVSALGVATLVAPLVGTHLRAEADTASGTTADAGASTARAAAAASLASATDLVAERATRALALSRDSAREAGVQATAERASAAKAAAEAAALALQEEQQRQLAEQEAAAKAAADHQAAVEQLVGQCSGDRPAMGGTRNGRLTDGQMCDLWTNGHQLRSDAAVAFAELNLAYRDHFGKDIVITDSYRSYAAQVAVRRKKPGLAAVPGTSEHGWGLAVDLGDGVQNSDEHYDWLIENAPKYGWDHPVWARKGGGGPYEPWHWEFVAGE